MPKINGARQAMMFSLKRMRTAFRRNTSAPNPGCDSVTESSDEYVPTFPFAVLRFSAEPHRLSRLCAGSNHCPFGHRQVIARTISEDFAPGALINIRYELVFVHSSSPRDSRFPIPGGTVALTGASNGETSCYGMSPTQINAQLLGMMYRRAGENPGGNGRRRQ